MSLDVARHFGANLHNARKRSGLSQKEVSWRASLHQTEISQLERGGRTPRIDTLIKIAAALELPIECELLAGITWTLGSIRAGAFTLSSPSERHAALMERAAALRARQPEVVDAAALVR